MEGISDSSIKSNSMSILREKWSFKHFFYPENMLQILKIGCAYINAYIMR